MKKPAHSVADSIPGNGHDKHEDQIVPIQQEKSAQLAYDSSDSTHAQDPARYQGNGHYNMIASRSPQNLESESSPWGLGPTPPTSKIEIIEALETNFLQPLSFSPEELVCCLSPKEQKVLLKGTPGVLSEPFTPVNQIIPERFPPFPTCQNNIPLNQKNLKTHAGHENKLERFKEEKATKVLGESNKQAPSREQKSAFNSLKRPIGPSTFGSSKEKSSKGNSVGPNSKLNSLLSTLPKINNDRALNEYNNDELTDFHLFFQPLSLTVNTGFVQYNSNSKNAPSVDIPSSELRHAADTLDMKQCLIGAISDLPVEESEKISDRRFDKTDTVKIHDVETRIHGMTGIASIEESAHDCVNDTGSGFSRNNLADFAIPSWFIPGTSPFITENQYNQKVALIWDEISSRQEGGSAQVQEVFEMISDPESNPLASALGSSLESTIESSSTESQSKPVSPREVSVNNKVKNETNTKGNLGFATLTAERPFIQEQPSKKERTKSGDPCQGVKFAEQKEVFHYELLGNAKEHGTVPKMSARPKSSSKMFTMSMRDKPYSPPKPSWYKASYGTAHVKIAPPEIHSTSLDFTSKSAGGMPVTSIYLQVGNKSKSPAEDLEVDGDEDVPKVVEEEPENPNMSFGNWKDKYTAQVQQNFAGCFDDIDDFIEEFNAKTDVIVEYAAAAAATLTASTQESRKKGRRSTEKTRSPYSNSDFDGDEEYYSDNEADEEIESYQETPSTDHGKPENLARLSTEKARIGSSKRENDTASNIDNVIVELAQEIGTLKSIKLGTLSASKPPSPMKLEKVDPEVNPKGNGGKFKNMLKQAKTKVRRHFRRDGF